MVFIQDVLTKGHLCNNQINYQQIGCLDIRVTVVLLETVTGQLSLDNYSPEKWLPDNYP